MGREWYFNWGSGKSSSSKKAGGGGGGGRGGDGGGREKKPIKSRQVAAVVASGGCMNALIHMFDFHHYFQHSSYLSDNNDNYPSNGVEAPRNSLSNIEDEKNYPFNIPVLIKTNRRDTGLLLKTKEDDTIEKALDSPALSVGARTPTLVARLMGLDVLPESSTTSTPRSSSSYSRLLSTTRSPTSSTTSTKTRTNNSYHNMEKHRLSLQIDKENDIVKEIEFSRRRSCSVVSENTKRRDENSTSSSSRNYAKQVMKQAKESVVSRRRVFGNDISNNVIIGANNNNNNIINNNNNEVIRKDISLLIEEKRVKKPVKVNKVRLVKNSEIISKKIVEVIGNNDDQEVVKMEVVSNEDEKNKCCDNKKEWSSSKKTGLMKSYESVRNKKDDEQFVRRLSMTRVHHHGLSIEKKCKIAPPTKYLDKQGSPKTSTIIRKPGRQTTVTAQQEAGPAHKLADHKQKKIIGTTTSTSIAEFEYISKILNFTSISSFTTWFSPFHPLDPNIYHKLESAASNYFTSVINVNIYPLPFDVNLNLPVNRKLIFHLVDEILAEILLRTGKHEVKNNNGLELVKKVCERIRSFTSVEVKTIQDIDALVDQEMPRFGDDCCEAIVAEIERDIVDSLIREMVAALV